MANYYLSTTGNNGSAGTLAAPWLTPNYAFNRLAANDNLYVLGGTYTLTGTVGGGYNNGVYVSSKNGSATNKFSVFNYNTTPVIFDCVGITGGTYSKVGINLNNCSYWRIKGIEEKNAVQDSGTKRGGNGFFINAGHHNEIENCVAHHNGGPGFITRTPTGDDNTFLNCDAHSNFDAYTGTPGDNSDGFDLGFGRYGGGDYHQWIIGCRSWNNGDDGFDCYQYANYSSIYHFINCWSWHNGYSPGDDPAGDGNGFKLGLDGQTYSGVTKRFLYNCIAYNNRTRGFSQESARVKKEFYNCLAYDNSSHGFSFGWTGDASGLQVADVLRNNISFGNSGDAVENLHGGTFYATRVSDHNSWDAGAPTVTSADFEGITSQLETARQSNGYLPIMSFLHLAAGSDLIGAGSATGIYYSDGDDSTWDSPPAIGPFEYGGVTEILVTGITVSGAGGDTTINIDNDTLQMLAAILPTNATNQTVTWSVAPGTGTASISSSGLLLAITDGTVTVTATANDTSGITDDFVITIYNQSVPVGTKTFAPYGWHVPSLSEWQTLLDELATYHAGDNNWPLAGNYLKEQGTTHWNATTGSITNSSGFTAFGSGSRVGSDGSYANRLIQTWITSSTLYSSGLVNVMNLAAGSSIALLNDNPSTINEGLPVRLVKDSTSLSDGETGFMTDYDGIVYPTICIGTQEWMAMNYVCSHYSDGTPIPHVTDPTAWAALTTAGMCYYNNDIIVLNSLTYVPIQQKNTLFNDQPSFTVTSPVVIDFEMFWEIRNEAHAVLDSGSETISITSGTHVYSFSGIMVPNEIGMGYDFRIGKTATMAITSNHFEIRI